MSEPIAGDLVATNIQAPSVPYARRRSRRALLLLAAAPIAAFGIAFAAGATTKTNPSVRARLAPAARSANSPVGILAVSTVSATPALKVPPKRPVARRAKAKSTLPVVTPTRSAPSVTTPVTSSVTPVTPVIVPRTTVPVAPVTPTPRTVPTGGGSGSKGGSGGGTGTVSGGG